MRITRFLSRRNLSTGIPLRNRIPEPAEQLSKPAPRQSSTVDVTNVKLLSKFSVMWWDANGQLRPLHSLNPLRVQFVRDGLANTGLEAETPSLPLEGLKILDVGCGGGILSEPLARIGARVTGIDASEELIATAKEHATLDSNLAKRLNYVCASVEDFSEQNEETFDAVVASEVVEHVNDPQLFLQCCTNVVKPGGSVFLTTFNRTLPSWLGGIVAAEHILKIIPLGTHDWNKFVTPQELQRMLESCSCKTKLIHGMFYNPLRREWSWSTSTALNYALHAVKRGNRK